jgi:hypothetical protein
VNVPQAPQVVLPPAPIIPTPTPVPAPAPTQSNQPTNAELLVAIQSVDANVTSVGTAVGEVRNDIADIPAAVTLGHSFVLKNVNGSGKDVSVTPVFLGGCYRTLSLPKNYPAIVYHNDSDIPRMPLGSKKITDMKGAYDKVLKLDARFGGSGFADPLQQRIVDDAFASGEIADV